MATMNANARARANIARPGKRQTLAGLDPYHRLLRETQEQPSLPYSRNGGSFSVPRPSQPTALGQASPLRPAESATATSAGFDALSDGSVPEEMVALRVPVRVATGSLGANATIRLVSVSESMPAAERPAPLPVRSLTRSPEELREKGDIVDARLSWRPLFLYRRVLTALAALFLILLIILEVLLAVSNRRTGLFEESSASRHLSQYGSAAVSVIIAAVWAKVEFQSKSAAPWLRLSQGFAQAEKSLLLDYLSMPQPQVIFQAYKNGDGVVAGSTIISMLLLGLVFQAATLLTPFTFPMFVPDAPVTLRTAFVDDSSALEDIGNWPYVDMLELQTTNLNPPAGVSTQFAFQDFDSNFRSPTLLNTTVDGFAGGLTCEQAAVMLTNVGKISNNQIFLNVTVSSTGCNTRQTISLTEATVPGQDNLPKQVLTMQPGRCGGSLALDAQRVVIVSGTARVDPGAVEALDPSAKAFLGIGLTTATALLCQPNYSITTLHVAKNQTGLVTQPTIASNGNGARVLPNVHPWQIAQSHFDSYDARPPGPGFFAVTSPLYRGQAVVDMDEPMAAVIATRTKRAGAPPRLSTLQDAATLTLMAQEYFQQFSALVVSSGLTTSIAQPVTAPAIIMRRRLIMRSLPTHSAAVILGLCAVGAIALTLYVPKRGFLPRNPGSIAGVATLLSNSSSLLQALRGAGGLDMDIVRERLEQKVYYVDVQDTDPSSKSAIPSFRIRGGKGASQPPRLYSTRGATPWEKPLLLRWLIRLVAGFVVIALIIVLEAGLQGSRQGDGFGLVDNSRSSNQYFLWTLLPVALLIPLSEYLLLTDFYTRAIAPFLRLLNGAEFDESLGLELLGVPRVLALRRALLTRNYFVVLTILAALVAPLLLVVSTGLVTTFPVDIWRNVSTAQAMPVMKVAVRQDVISTRILEAFLAVLLVLLFLSWYSTKGSGSLPRPTTSIASIAAYLVDGNFLEVLPRDAEWLSLSQIQETLRRGYEVMYADLTWETTTQAWRGGRNQDVELFGIRIMRWGGVNMQMPMLQ
ncbi:hypothetical protein HJFPF1_05433 [Paramyrothecium foliicola]|nr:hypothetical protein HJFPF1_05433 [Paramyrothecium foliicola]